MLGHFWAPFSRQVASPSPACGVRKKCSQKHDIQSSLAFGATCKKAKQVHKKTCFLKKKGLEKGHPQKDLKQSRFSTFLGGPKRLKTDHFEVKIASSTSNGTFLRLLKKFFSRLKRHSILHRFFMHFQPGPGPKPA